MFKMKNILFLATGFILVGCSGPTNDDATSVCSCYKELYKVSADETVMMEAIADSCGKLHADVLRKLENDPEAHKTFIEAYTFCQNEK
jgi:hypothetical protein